MYCIYTDRDVPESLGNWDHVIPLALGGKNQFTVWSDKSVNAKLGTEVEGALKRDPLLVFALRNARVKGHGGSVANPIWKRVDLNGRPTQMTWGMSKVTAWDARDRRELEEHEYAGQELSARLTIDLHVTTRFLAKVALGAGYFIYGDEFKAATDCAPLRDLALLPLQAIRQSPRLASGITICDRFHEDSHVGGEAYLYRVLMEQTNRSLVIAVPHDDSIAFHIGLVGVYIGSIVCSATTTALPFGEEHDLGHALRLAPGDLERLSFRALAQEFYRMTTDQEPPAAPQD